MEAFDGMYTQEQYESLRGFSQAWHCLMRSRKPDAKKKWASKCLDSLNTAYPLLITMAGYAECDMCGSVLPAECIQDRDGEALCTGCAHSLDAE